MKSDCGIYCITNLLNNKKYIGQSIQISKRWQQHRRCNGLSHHSAIAQAILKYGVENFKFEVLEYCSPEDLNNREAYYAEHLNTYAPNGYNINVAGEAFHNAANDVEISCYDLQTGKLIQTFSSLHEAERAGYQRMTIANCAKHLPGYTMSHNLAWEFGHEPVVTIRKPKAGSRGGKTVYQYDLQSGNYIQEFKSLADAERYLQKPGGNKNISAVCLGKRNCAYGYYWSYIQVNNYFTLKESK